jgi:hypothetical protein
MFLRQVGYLPDDAAATHVAIHVGRGRIIHNNLVYPSITFENGAFFLRSGVFVDLLHSRNYLQKPIVIMRNASLSEYEKRSVSHFAAQRLKGTYNMLPLLHAFMLKMDYADTRLDDPWSDPAVRDVMAQQCASAANVCSNFVEQCFVDAVGSKFPMVGNSMFPFPLPPDFLNLPDFETIIPSVVVLD